MSAIVSSDKQAEEIIKVSLAEFQSLRQEITSRFDNQRQAFGYLTTLLGAAITLITFLHKESILDTYALAVICSLMPFVFAPSAFIFFDNEIVIWALQAYLDKTLRETVTNALGSPSSNSNGVNPGARGVLLLEQCRFSGINKASVKCHFVLSVLRWVMFLFPCIAAVIASVCFLPSGAYLLWPVIAFDCCFIVVLCWAIKVAVYERRQLWKNQE